MFSRGGIQKFGPGGGFKPRIKTKFNPKDIAEKYGIKGLEWIQRKIAGGSWLPEWMQQRLLNQSLKELDENYGAGASKSLGFSDIETKTTVDPTKINTKEYTSNSLLDTLKWGNEGWLNPLGYVPKVGPLPLRPPRMRWDNVTKTYVPNETLGGAGKEIAQKTFKGLTAAGAYGWGTEALKSDEVKLQEKTINELETKDIKNADQWVMEDSLPQKTIKNELLENLKENLIKDRSFMGDDYLGNQLPEIISDLKQENEDTADHKAVATSGSDDVENFNTPITNDEAESGNVVDMNKHINKHEKNKGEMISGTGNLLDYSHLEETVSNEELNETVTSSFSDNINVNNKALEGMMELEPDDLSDIKQYMGFLQGIMGKRDPMIGASLLMQLGTSLMNAKTTKQGIEGFLQAAGQAGAEIAPQLMKLGALSEEKKQSLATAALQMYMDKMKDARPSGSPYMVAEIDWKQNESGDWYASGTKPAKMYQLNSDEFRNAMAEDNAYFEAFNRPKYYFGSPQDPSTAGIFQASVPEGDKGPLISDTSRDAFQQTGGYMGDILDVGVPYLTTLIDFPELMGASGYLAEKGLGGISTIKDSIAVFTGDFPEWESTMAKGLLSARDEFETGWTDAEGQSYGGLTNRSSNSTMNMGGQSIPVFIDWNNDLGMNSGGVISKSRDTRLVHENGIRTYMVKDGFDKFFNAEVLGQQDLISRTIGIGYARSRQPTGRMLADVLQGSMKDARFVGIGTDPKANRTAVLTAHVGIINEMYEKIDTAYRNAGITNNPDKVNPQSKHYVEGLRYIKEFDGGKIPGTDNHMWSVKKIREFANKYYTLKSQVPGMQDLPELTFYTFNQWEQDGEIQLQNEVIGQDKEQKGTVENIRDKFDQGFNILMGNQ